MAVIDPQGSAPKENITPTILIKENEEDGEHVISLVTQKQLKGLIHEYIILEIRRARDKVMLWIQFNHSAGLCPLAALSLALIWRVDDMVKYASTERQLGIRGMPTKVLAHATFKHGPTLREENCYWQSTIQTSFNRDVWGSVRRGKVTP
ncbi:hypothetical protein BS47DRAFT_1363932 [Hydnum rufescens UP504]|uniref:Uncharacterized protein n=1 Tax=Hydnum rufescens UP504 TaxID=1448309 RepID=A0A9P6ASV8_9AGAM|nr:hypothetical protein BS47DRAFT_1363932 [Hydnum rufescens UP504]